MDDQQPTQVVISRRRARRAKLDDAATLANDAMRPDRRQQYVARRVGDRLMVLPRRGSHT